MNFRKQFVQTLATILGVNDPLNDSSEVTARLDALESACMEKFAEIDGIKEIITVLIMMNPNVSVIGRPDDASDFITSGSGGQGPDGKLLN